MTELSDCVFNCELNAKFTTQNIITILRALYMYVCMFLYVRVCVRLYGMFSYSAISSRQHSSMRFTLHPKTYQLIPTQAFIHVAITARRLFIHIIYPPVSLARYSFIQLSELWQRGVNKIAQVSKRQQEDSSTGSLGC